MVRYLWPSLIVLVLLLSGASAAAAATAAEPVQGDVNCDAAVNSIDSLQILRSVAGLSTTAQCLADAGDVNCDDAVNSVDCGIAGVTSLPANDFFDVNNATIPDIPEPTPTPTPTPAPTPAAVLGAEYRAAAASNMCDEIEFLTFRRDATTFSGSCYDYDGPEGFYKYEWSFTWMSDPPK